MLKHKKPETLCAVVRNISRKDHGTSLGELRDMEVDMFTTVFIGNAQTKLINGQMVTGKRIP